MDSPTVYCPNGCLEFGINPRPMKLRYGTWEPCGVREASCSRCGFEAPWVPVLESDLTELRARVAELEAAMERIIAGPYAGQFGSAVEVAAEALKR